MPQRYNYSSIFFAILHVLFYTVLYWVFAPQFRFAFGPDFISYTAIAEKYSNGNFSGAVNAWWSPAYSWLLATGSFFSDDILLVNKLIQFFAGIVALLLLRRIIFFHTPVKKDVYAEWLLLAFVPALVWWALTADTPDFCAAVVLLWFLYQVLKLSVQFTVGFAVCAGVAGAVAYLFKSYNFWFISFFGLAVLLYEIIARRNLGSSIKKWGCVAVSFLLFSIIWVAVLQSRFQQFTISSIGWHQPCANEYVLTGKPIAAAADCAPLQFLTGNRYSNWETPGTYPMVSISAYLSENGIDHIFGRNIGHFFKSFVSRYQLIILVILLIAGRAGWRKFLFYYAAYWGIYCGGYFLFHLEARFFIMPSILLMLGITISYLRVAETITGKWLHTAGILALSVLFAHSYLYNLWKFNSSTVPQKVYRFVQQNPVEKNRNIAAAAGLYDEGLYFSFFTGNRFYGSLTMPEQSTEADAELKKNNIDYLLVWRKKEGFVLVKGKQ